MLEFLTRSNNDAIALLKKDHDKVKGLFDQFEKAESLREKKQIAAEASMELKIHASIEEEIFYPAVRKAIGKKIMNEADEEHHVAKVLIAELERMSGSEDHYEAKFKVLSENVRHHIREEEGEMLPQARELDMDFEVLGKQLLARKQQLMKKGIAVFAEEKMVARSGGKGDSPARASRMKPAKRSAGKTAKSRTKTRAKARKNTMSPNGKARHKNVRSVRH